MTKQSPDALSNKKRLTYNGYRGVKDGVDSFKKWVNENANGQTFGDSAQTERILGDYRAWLESEMGKGRYSPSTVGNKGRILRGLIKWLWQNRHIADLPRNMDTVCAQYQAK